MNFHSYRVHDFSEKSIKRPHSKNKKPPSERNSPAPLTPANSNSTKRARTQRDTWAAQLTFNLGRFDDTLDVRDDPDRTR